MSEENTAIHTETECACPHFIRAMLLLQEKWALLIIYSLMAGPVGFSRLMRRGKINTTTLTQRLNMLESAGLLVKTIHSTMPPRTSYELTESGRALKPVLESISDWSARYLSNATLPLECAGQETGEGICSEAEIRE